MPRRFTAGASPPRILIRTNTCSQHIACFQKRTLRSLCIEQSLAFKYVKLKTIFVNKLSSMPTNSHNLRKCTLSAVALYHIFIYTLPNQPSVEQCLSRRTNVLIMGKVHHEVNSAFLRSSGRNSIIEQYALCSTNCNTLLSFKRGCILNKSRCKAS